MSATKPNDSKIRICAHSLHPVVSWRLGQDGLAHAIIDCDPRASMWEAWCGRLITGPEPEEMWTECPRCKAATAVQLEDTDGKWLDFDLPFKPRDITEACFGLAWEVVWDERHLPKTGPYRYRIKPANEKLSHTAPTTTP